MQLSISSSHRILRQKFYFLLQQKEYNHFKYMISIKYKFQPEHDNFVNIQPETYKSTKCTTKELAQSTSYFGTASFMQNNNNNIYHSNIKKFQKAYRKLLVPNVASTCFYYCRQKVDEYCCKNYPSCSYFVVYLDKNLI